MLRERLIDFFLWRLQAGDVIFIPEGYWHQIKSSSGTVAVNVWFRSRISTVVVDGISSEFYRTRLLQTAVTAKAQDMLDYIAHHPALLMDDESVRVGRLCLTPCQTIFIIAVASVESASLCFRVHCCYHEANSFHMAERLRGGQILMQMWL